MNPALFIRKHVLNLSQAELAAVLGVSQPTVQRREARGEYHGEALRKLRALVRERRPDWSDSWFFEVPPEIVAAATLSTDRAA